MLLPKFTVPSLVILQSAFLMSKSRGFSLPSSSATSDPFATFRSTMVNTQIINREVTDQNVIASMNKVPRHLFVAEGLMKFAYQDSPLPILKEQTISQPYIVAYMAEQAKLQRTDKVLEIGTGCGYSAAVLSHCASVVYTVETIPELAEEAKERLHALHYENIHCFHSDGSMGLPEFAPYDAIVVTAAAPQVPKSLTEQLAVNGRLVIPVRMNGGDYEVLMRITKREDEKLEEEHLLPVRFVPLVGKEGYATGNGHSNNNHNHGNNNNNGK